MKEVTLQMKLDVTVVRRVSDNANILTNDILEENMRELLKADCVRIADVKASVRSIEE
jgi:hypothetical protein